MGQLEKYGLYVLCLVIFLILGVTIWGGGDLPPPTKGQTSAMKATGQPEIAAVPRDRGVASLPDFDSLLNSARSGLDPKPDTKKPAPANGPANPAIAPKDAGEREANGERATEPPKSSPTGRRPTHKVRSKDTFEGIAKEVLGNAALRTEISRLNPGIEPTRLKLGQELQLPTTAEIAQWNTARIGTPGPAEQKPASSPKTKDAAAVPAVYTVAKGDTFERIAAVALGSKKRVNELLELNPTIAPRELTPGMKIKLPKK